MLSRLDSILTVLDERICFVGIHGMPDARHLIPVLSASSTGTVMLADRQFTAKSIPDLVRFEDALTAFAMPILQAL